METTDATARMSSLAIDLNRTSDRQKSRISLLGASSDGGDFQINEVSHY